MKPKVYITRQVPQEGIDRVRQVCDVEIWEDELPVPRDLLLEKVADIDGLYCLLTEAINEELLDHAPNLKVVSNMAVGYDNVDVEACTRRGIVVGNTPGVLTETTADLAWALLMAVARRIVEADRYVREGRWQTWGPMLLMGNDVHAATLGIIGLGRIGSAVARRAGGFGMRVLYYDPFASPEVAVQVGAEEAELDTLLRESDFVTIHCLLTEETYHLIGAEEFRKMKPSAILINAARGGIVDLEALCDALVSGQIAGAGLDVTEPEPIPPDHRLLSLDNVVILPHIGSASIVTRTQMAIMAAENLLAGLRGEQPPHCVNPEALQQR